jgi:hypothetical protein
MVPNVQDEYESAAGMKSKILRLCWIAAYEFQPHITSTLDMQITDLNEFSGLYAYMSFTMTGW